MGTIFCIFGDSVTYGFADFEQGGWVARLRKFLDQKTLSDSENYFVVYELGVSGETTAKLLKRFEVECGARLAEREEYNEQAVILFSIGINDTQFLHKENRLRASPEEFKENLQKLITLARKFTPRIIFLGLTPVDEAKTTPIPWNPIKSYKNEYIQKYNNIIKSVCTENSFPFIEIFEKLIKLNYQELLEDGLHPNFEGHRKMFETVKDFLIEKKII